MNRGQAFLAILLGVISILTFVIILPFLEYVLVAIILAYVLYPVHTRLENYIGGIASALFLIVSSLVILIVPLLYILSVFIRDLRAVARGESDLKTNVLEERIFELTGVDVDIVELLSLGGQTLVNILFDGYTGIVSLVFTAALGIALVLFLVFYLLRDGAAFIVWLRRTIPLPAHVTNRLFEKIDKTMWGAVIGHGFAAFVQAIVAGIGLYFVGIPNVVFWTFVMMVLAFLPLIGAFLVWGPAAVYLVLIGNTTMGVTLAVYGIIVVSMIDYYARPLVIDQQARLNPGVILVGVFGGVFTLGFVGLFIGPIAIGALAATLEMIHEDYHLV